MRTTLLASDGVALAVRWWPAVGPAKGTVLIVHGLGEHIARYAHVADALVAEGWCVAGHDQRGHGASGGARGRLRSPDDLLADLAVVLDAVRAERPGPVVLLGHSLGGLVAARFAAGGSVERAGADGPQPSWWRPVDALVLSSPALRIAMSGLQRAALAVLGQLAPNAGMANGLKPEWISRDPAVVAAYEADPLVHDRISAKLARFMLDAMAAVREAAPRWRVPTLLLYAGADRCVVPAGSTDFGSATPRGIVSARTFPALFHELFNEPERAEVLSVLAGWLDTLDVSPARSPP